MKVSIIIPTYNEKENIPKLFERIFKVFNENKIDGEIIVVDDNSPDGTADVANKYSKNFPVKVITRKEEKGLASACVEGFKHAKGDIFIVMDADLQHPPEKIPELIFAIKKGADIAIASRYVGNFGLNLSLGRKLISKLASKLAETFFWEIKEIKDKESGFFAFKKEVIKDIELKPKGYKILLEILILGNYNKVKEIGYKFGKRYAGKSKMSFNVVFSYLIHLMSLLWRSGKLMKFLKFCIVGVIGVAINLGILYFLTNFGLYYMISGAVAIEASLLSNFFLNRIWTFRREAKHIGIGSAIVKDHITRLMGILINLICLFAFTELFHFYYIISMLIGIVASTLWNFIGNVRWVWKT